MSQEVTNKLKDCIDILNSIKHVTFTNSQKEILYTLKNELTRLVGNETSGIREYRKSRAQHFYASYDAELPEAVSLHTRDKFKSNSCYVCRLKSTNFHHFYDKLCADCGDFNFLKRFQSSDLTGRVAIVTGGRIKIGFEICLKLLRAGAHVICTTRFTEDAMKRYSSEKDYNDWCSRLEILEVEFLQFESINLFLEHIHKNYDRLDILINNAAQTLQRDEKFYKPLIEMQERKLITSEESSKTTTIGNFLLKFGAHDEHMQLIVPEKKNSWTKSLQEVEIIELFNVTTINAMVPFIIIQGVTKRMRDTAKNGTLPCWIINVSSMEGRFDRNKSEYHPHTNMAKASLNMMTHTIASEYARYGIYVNSSDTGWVTEENPDTPFHSFNCPIDEVDGAARVLDPIFTGSKVYGKFFKDYKPCTW